MCYPAEPALAPGMERVDGNRTRHGVPGWIKLIWKPDHVKACSRRYRTRSSPNGCGLHRDRRYRRSLRSDCQLLAIDPGGPYAYAAGWRSAPGGLLSQFAIGGGGTLSPLTPVTVATTQTAIGIAVAPSGQTAYVLSTCVDSACDGQVAPYMIGANGALTATGSNTLTGGHVNPVAMVADGAGSNVYLLTNYMGVDTNTGAVYQYAIGSMGTLVSDTPASLGVSSGAVAESTYGSHLYVLSANYIGFTSGAQTGGYIDYYDMGTDGRLSAVNTTPVVRGWLTAMAVVVAH